MKENTPADARVKLIIGYSMLILLLFISIYYVYTEMKKVVDPDVHEQAFYERRRQINQIAVDLYRSEVIGQSLAIGQQRDFTKYRNAIDQVLFAIHRLSEEPMDTLQRARFDTISTLLIEKKQSMRLLLSAMNESNANELYNDNVERALHSQDSLLGEQRVRRRTVVKHSSYVKPRKKKGFFKRVADVFSGKPDTTLVTDTSREVIVDTLLNAYNPADTVATILKNIQLHVSENKEHARRTVNQRAREFRINGLQLSEKLNQLMAQVEQEEQLRLNTKLAQAQHIRARSITIISLLAISALVMAVVFLLLIWRDITRSNHYRAELEKAKAKAEELLASREQLMLTITHDIKAPLSSIIGYIDLLLRLVSEERPRFYLENMSASARHLLDLVHSFLDFHRLESRKVESSRVEFNPGELLEEIRHEFEPLVRAKQLHFDFHCERSLYSTFVSDPLQIRQMIENLLSNALKFTVGGHIGLSVEEKEGEVIFSVSDTGCGMSADEQKRIFQEFVRLPNAQNKQGVGLGLAIVSKLAPLLGGRVEVQSQTGCGSTFRILLPLQRSRFVRALMIDDDPLQRHLTQAMLESGGVTVCSCDTPDTLFAHLEAEEFDVLLTDMQMPAMSGLQLLEAVRASHLMQAQHIPVLALTARRDLTEQSLLEAGFAGVLYKPFSQGQLYATLCRFASSSLHFEALTAFSEDDPKAKAEIIHTFIVETQKNREQMLQALEAKDGETIFLLAHRLLPLFSMLGAKASMAPLEWLERGRGTALMNEEVVGKAQQVLKEMDFVIHEAEWLYTKKKTEWNHC